MWDELLLTDVRRSSLQRDVCSRAQLALHSEAKVNSAFVLHVCTYLTMLSVAQTLQRTK
jgi:hypothetical protein